MGQGIPLTWSQELNTLPSKLYWNAYTLWHARREAKLPGWPLGRIEALRDRRFRGMVEHAYRTVPFYRRLFDDLSLVPGDFQTADDLSKLPVQEFVLRVVSRRDVVWSETEGYLERSQARWYRYSVRRAATGSTLVARRAGR